jgi:predicted transcriptional regulator
MKRIEEVYREMLFESIEKNNNNLTQSYLAKALNISLSIVNLALRPLKQMNAIKIKQRSFDIIDKKKMLYYWASFRNLEKDIIYKTRVEKPIRRIESEMPSDIVFAAYSAYKFIFKDVPADYSEVYVYSDSTDEIKKRFPLSKGTPNLFVLKKDKNLKKTTLANLFVDLWNLKEWYAKDFLNALEVKLNAK